MRQPLAPLLPSLLAVALLAGTAGAQLDLPGKDKRPASKPQSAGNVVPHLVCTVCYERNYTTKIDLAAEGGLQSAWCRVCRRDTLHRRALPGQTGKGGRLDLPSELPGDGAGTGEAPTRPGAGPPLGPQPAPGDGTRAAVYIFREVAKLDTPKSALADEAVNSLRTLGDEGFREARRHILGQHTASLMVAARVLLSTGRPEDVELVVHRLDTRLPAKAAPALVDVLVAGDPVRGGSPRLLIQLLDHVQSGVRAAAFRHLRERAAPEHLPLLAEKLKSDRGDTRERAIGLVARIDDPGVLELLLECVDDPRARVAWAAVSAVAVMEDPRVDVELLGRAFGGRWILRENAYALLTLVEREDRRLEKVLDRSHAEALLIGLTATDPFVSGVCAAALAGIGFRDPEPKSTPWLDREVMDRLVYAVSGREFHNDYSSLLGPAVRRLELLTEATHGTDGPAWVDWWLAAREGFFAHRAWMHVGPEDEAKVRVAFMGGGGQAEAFALVGTDLAAAESLAPALGERFFLTPGEARELAALLRREGVFGPERLPGRRGPRNESGRSLEVLVDGRGKRFTFTAGRGEPWFESVLSTCRSLRDQNRWQRYPTPGVHAGPYALWLAEGAWWQEVQDAAVRATRLKALVFEYLAPLPPSDRNGGVGELVRLYSEGHVERDDFPSLVELMRGEPRLSGRATQIVELAMTCAEAGGEVDGARAAELAYAVEERYGDAGTDLLGTIYSRAGLEFVRGMTHDQHALLRAVAATVLGGVPVQARTLEDRTLLGSMLSDEDATVEAAACLSLGRLCAGGARGGSGEEHELLRAELLLRARVARSPVREAALESIGLMGGPDVLEALVVGLAEPDPLIKRAAVQGIASLGDPASAPLLVSLLGQGPESLVFAPARKGLRDLGEAAWSDLLRVAHSSTARARREAALLLAEQGAPQAASVLISLLTEYDEDLRVAEELAVLSCVDFRAEATPSLAWWEWWDTVVHDDSLAWFLAALERRDLTPPGKETFLLARRDDDVSAREVARFLLDLMQTRVSAPKEAHLVERARRELAAVLGKELGALPATRADRDVWLSTLRETVERSWDE